MVPVTCEKLVFEAVAPTHRHSAKARAAVRRRDPSLWDERAMARFVPRGRGGQDRLSAATCAAAQFAPATRVRERAGARRWARSERARRVRGGAVRMDLPSVCITRPRSPRSVSDALSPATCNPLPRGCRLGRATGVTPIDQALWRDPSGGFVLSGHEMDTRSPRSCTKFENWNRPP